MRGCSTGGSSGRASACSSGAGTSDLIRNERYQHTTTSRGIEHARPSDAWNHFSSTPVDVDRQRASVSKGPRSCIVAACASSTIAIGQAADAVRSGRVDAAVAGGTDALARLTFSGFNALRSDGSGAVPAVRSRPRRNEHRRRRRDPGARGHGARDGARRAHLRRAGRLQPSACEAYHPTAPEPDGAPVRGDHVELRCADAGVDADARRPRQRPRHRHAAERSGRGARLPERVRRAHAATCR